MFDLDGTLIDSVPGIARALREAFRCAGKAMPEGEVSQFVGPPIRVIARGLDPSLTDADLSLIEPAYRASYDSDGWRHSALYPEVTETLTHLRAKGLPLFVVTNKPRLPTARLLAHFELDSLFTEVLSRDSREPPYPEKASMLADLICRRKLRPEQAWMVGDTAEDGEAAARCGMPFVYATYGYGGACGALTMAQNAALTPALTTIDRIAHIRRHLPSEGTLRP